MRARTSVSGLPQFSLLKANKVSTSMPLSLQPFSAERTASTPARCPAGTGSPRRLAHRPLPSIIMAICRGSGRHLIKFYSKGLFIALLPPKQQNLSNFHQIGFFRSQCFFYLSHKIISQFLDDVLSAAFIIFRNLFIF